MTTTTVDFTGATGAAWPAGWSGDSEGGVILEFDIDSNRGRLQVNNSSYPSGHKVFDTLGALAKTELLCTLDASSTAENYQGVGVLCSDSGWTAEEPANGILVETAHFGDAILLKYVGGVRTQLAVLATGLGVTADHKVRLRADSTTGDVKAKVWAAAGAEPGSWQYDAIPASPLLASGKPAVYGFGGNFSGIQTLWWDDFIVDDLASAAAASRPPTPRLRRAHRALLVR